MKQNKKLQTRELETLASVAVTVTQGTLSQPGAGGESAVPTPGWLHRQGGPSQGQCARLGLSGLVTIAHLTPKPHQVPEGGEHLAGSSVNTAFLPSPRLVSSRAKSGLPRISCRTCDPVTSLPTEALLPNWARKIPHAAASESTAMSVQTSRLAGPSCGAVRPRAQPVTFQHRLPLARLESSI